MGLDVASPVMLSGSDAQAALFNSVTLPAMLSYHNNRSLLSDPNASYTGESFLTLSQDTTVRIYFIAESAGYRNTLAVNTTDTGLEDGTPGLIFPNASMHGSRHMPDNARRQNHAPVASGDFVDLGTFEAGTQIDLMLLSDGARRTRDVWSTDSDRNEDDLDHARVVAMQHNPNQLLVGWEDLRGGGDRDYNDMLLGIEMIPAGTIPEPATAMLVLFGSLVVTARPRRERPPKTN